VLLRALCVEHNYDTSTFDVERWISVS